MTKEELKELARKSRDPEILDRLSRDKEYWVRGGVAGNRNTPAYLLDRLNRDGDWEVLEELEGNPKWQAVNKSARLDVARLASKWLGIL